GQGAHEGHEEGDDGGAGDDLDGVDAGDGHDADVLAVGGGGHRAHEAGDGGGQVVAQQGAVEARVLDEVPAHDLAGDHLVADVLRGDDQDDGGDGEDGVEVELGQVELGQ